MPIFYAMVISVHSCTSAWAQYLSFHQLQQSSFRSCLPLWCKYSFQSLTTWYRTFLKTQLCSVWELFRSTAISLIFRNIMIAGGVGLKCHVVVKRIFKLDPSACSSYRLLFHSTCFLLDFSIGKNMILTEHILMLCCIKRAWGISIKAVLHWFCIKQPCVFELLVQLYKSFHLYILHQPSCVHISVK